MAQTNRAFDKIQEIQRRKLAAVAKRETSPPVSDSSPLATGPPVLETGGLVSAERRCRIYPARIVQDGHSAGEQVMYDALWRHPQSAAMPDGSRRITIGRTGLVKAARVAEANAVATVRSLIRKLALEDEGSAGQSGRVYRVLPFSVIIDRRKSSGMVNVVRVSRAVHFVNAKGKYLDAEGGINMSPLVSETSPLEKSPLGGLETVETSPLETSPLPKNMYLGIEDRKDACPKCRGSGWFEWGGQKNPCPCQSSS
jgi:hypothetical protein